MHHALRIVIVAGAVLGAGACASAGSASAGGARHNLVTAEQLERAGDVSLYDALRSIRPSFLRSRQPGSDIMSAVDITVYVGGLQMMEGVEQLRQMRAKSVQEVEFLEPHQANVRYGTNNNGGALVIVMKP